MATDPLIEQCMEQRASAVSMIAALESSKLNVFNSDVETTPEMITYLKRTVESMDLVIRSVKPVQHNA